MANLSVGTLGYRAEPNRSFRPRAFLPILWTRYGGGGEGEIGSSVEVRIESQGVETPLSQGEQKRRRYSERRHAEGAAAVIQAVRLFGRRQDSAQDSAGRETL